MHYGRWKRYGDPLTKNRTGVKVIGSPAERFWAKVDKDGPAPMYRPALGPCWLWTGSRSVAGYGSFNVHGGRRTEAADVKLAHRFSYELAFGSIPTGMEIDHLCFVHDCVRPIHLEAVTPAENKRRSVIYREFYKTH